MNHLVFVINLKRRPDRLQAITECLPKEWKERAIFTTEWEGIVDGERIQTEEDLTNAGVTIFENWCIPGHTNSFWARPIKKGEIGCSFSHINVWRQAQEKMKNDKSLEFVVVLEDDAKFTNDAFERTLQTIDTLPKSGTKGWDLLYLGCVLQSGKINIPFNSLCQKPGFSYCTYGYVLSRKGVDKLLANELDKHLIAVDEFIPALYIPHPREDVRRLFTPCLNVFVTTPHCVTQRSKSEAGSNTEDSSVFIK